MRLPSGGCCMYLLWFVVTSWLAFLHTFCWLAPYTDEILDVDTSKSPLQHSLGCSVCSPITGIVPVSPTTRRGSANPLFNFWVGHSPLAFLFSVALKFRPTYFTLKWLNSYSFKKCTYLLKKTFFRVFVSIFSKYLVELQPCSPSDEPPLKGFYLTRNFGDRAKASKIQLQRKTGFCLP